MLARRVVRVCWLQDSPHRCTQSHQGPLRPRDFVERSLHFLYSTHAGRTTASRTTPPTSPSRRKMTEHPSRRAREVMTLHAWTALRTKTLQVPRLARLPQVHPLRTATIQQILLNLLPHHPHLNELPRRAQLPNSPSRKSTLRSSPFPSPAALFFLASTRPSSSATPRSSLRSRK